MTDHVTHNMWHVIKYWHITCKNAMVADRWYWHVVTHDMWWQIILTYKMWWQHRSYWQAWLWQMMDTCRHVMTYPIDMWYSPWDWTNSSLKTIYPWSLAHWRLILLIISPGQWSLKLDTNSDTFSQNVFSSLSLTC